MDLVGLPPDWLQSLLGLWAGSDIGRAAVSGSTVTSPSPVRTAIRCPRTGVLGPLPFFRIPQPLAASAPAIRIETRRNVALFIGVLLGLSLERSTGIDAKRASDLGGARFDGIGNGFVPGDGSKQLTGFLLAALLDHCQRGHLAGRAEPRLAGSREGLEARDNLLGL